MKQEVVRQVENLYDQTMRFLEGEGIAEKPPAFAPSRAEYQNTFRTVPEKSLFKDNLLSLLKDV